MDDEITAGSANPSRRKMDWVNYHLACLVIMAGPRSGEKIPLIKEHTVIGRQQDVEIPIEDILISRRHAEVARDNHGTPVLRDLDSKNGTFCNEEKIREKRLGEGDLIRVGGVILKYVGPDRVEIGDPGEGPEPTRRDALTGLLDTQSFSRHLGRHLARCKNLHSPLSLGLIDLDAFGKINEAGGRSAGDRLLKETADLFKNAIRPTDLLSRYDEDAFSLILPLTNLMGARIVGERIRGLVASHLFQIEDRNWSVTVSIGMAERRGGIEDLTTLIGRAENALGRAKHMGRNLTYCFMDPT
jgi:diguanylate cyclase (GGDEF)-like protein